jgi:GAF domain-containing protein
MAKESVQPGVFQPRVTRGGILRDGDALLDTTLALTDLAHDDPDEALRRIAGELRDLTGSRFCGIYEIESRYLRPLTVVERGKHLVDDLPIREFKVKHFKHIVRLVGTARPRALDDYGVPMCMTPVEGAQAYRSALLLPMELHDRVIGVVELCDAIERDYEEDVAMAGRLVKVAARAAVWAGDARRLTGREMVANELLELGDWVARARSLGDLVRPIAENLRTVIGAEDCDIWQANGDLITCLGSVDSNGWDADAIGDTYHLSNYPSYEAAMRTGSVRVITSADDERLAPLELEAFEKWGFRSNLSLPLIVDDETVGFIDIFDTRERDYAEHMEFVRNVGRLLAGAIHKALLLDQLEAGNRDLRLLLDISRALTSTGLLEEAMAVVARKASEALGVNSAVINEYVEEIDALVARASYDTLEDETYDGTGAPRHLSEFPGDRAILEGDEIVLEQASDPELDPATRESMAEYGEKTCLNVPLKVKGEPVGILMFLETREERRFTPHEIELARAVGELAALAIQNARLYRALRQKSDHDSLTHLHNARYLRQRVHEEMARARRHRTSLSLMVVDVDGYRRFTVDFGRAVGNDLLSAVAAIIKAKLHPYVDIGAHFGGGKFALLLPHTRLDGDGQTGEVSAVEDGWGGPHPHGALGVAERVRYDVETLASLASGAALPRPVTASVGVAAYVGEMHDSEALLDAAEEAVRRAKRAGKNRVEAAG